MDVAGRPGAGSMNLTGGSSPERERRALTEACRSEQAGRARAGPDKPELVLLNSRAGPGRMKTDDPGAAVSWRDCCSASRLGSLAEAGCRPRLPYSVSPNARKAVREHPGMNAVTDIRVRIFCGFHRARPERRRRSRDERWRLSAR